MPTFFISCVQKRRHKYDKKRVKIFEAYIREQRCAQGLTQEQLGFESDLPMQTISEIETGKRKVSGYMIQKLSEGLCIDPLELVIIYTDIVNDEIAREKVGIKNDI